jgi:hypothetical protein
MAQYLDFLNDDEDEENEAIAPPSSFEDIGQEDLAPQINDESDALLEDIGAEQYAQGLASQTQDPMIFPEAQDDLMTAQAKVNPLESRLNEYKQLQQESGKNFRNLAMFDALSQAGQAIAARHTPGFKPKSSLDLYEKFSQQPVNDYSAGIKQEGQDISLTDMQQMRDPGSKISEFYRSMAKKRGLEVDDNMSAWDLAQMSKIMGKQSEGKRFQQTRIFNPETGQVETKLVDVITGQISDSVGVSGFSQVVRQDPQSKELIRFNPGTGQQGGFVTGPTKAVQTPVTEQEKSKEVDIDAGFLTTSNRESLNTAREKFMTDTKDDRDALQAAQSISEALAAGKAIGGDIIRLVQNKFARASGERGAMTENDVKPFGGRADILSRIEASYNRWVKGKFSDKDRDFLTKLSRVMEKRTAHDIEQRSEFFVNNFKRDFEARTPDLEGRNVSKKSVQRLLGLEDVMYKDKPATSSGLKENEERRVTKDGKKAIFDRNTKQFLRFEQ